MLIKLYEENPSQKHIRRIVECLLDGGVIIYPTDTVYGIGCDIYKSKSVERIARLKQMNPKKARFSFICSDLSHLSDFCKPISTHVYKCMKRTLPGPFTFILETNNSVPKNISGKRKTVGIRVSSNNIVQEIIRTLGNPIMSTSIKSDEEYEDYMTDPELIYELYKNKVDIVIDGGYGDNQHSTIVDATSSDLEIVREGKGDLDLIW